MNSFSRPQLLVSNSDCKRSFHRNAAFNAIKCLHPRLYCKSHAAQARLRTLGYDQGQC